MNNPSVTLALAIILVLILIVIAAVKYGWHKKALEHVSLRFVKKNPSSSTETAATAPVEPAKVDRKKVSFLASIWIWIYGIISAAIGIALVCLLIYVGYYLFKDKPVQVVENVTHPTPYVTDYELNMQEPLYETVVVGKTYILTPDKWTGLLLPEKLHVKIGGCIKGLDSQGYPFYWGKACRQSNEFQGYSFEKIKLKAYGGVESTITFDHDTILVSERINYTLPG